MKKLVICATLACSVAFSSCAALTNNRKPHLRDSQAIAAAQTLGLVKRNNLYLWGNIAMLLVPIAGIAGLIVDACNYNYYEVTNMTVYDKWMQKYLENISKERERYLAE